jgi:alpha-mannosidase
MLEFSYVKPYTYELINGSYKVMAKVSELRSADELMVHFNGENLVVEDQENQDIQIWLPLIGDPGVLEISRTDGRKKSTSRQYFEPLVPADWDYFGEG